MDEVRLLLFPLVMIALSLASVCSAADPGGGVVTGMRPQRLRLEHLAEPLGIDVPTPRFSWEVASSERDDRQTAYQIVVGDDAKAVAEGTGSFWDSGRVEAAETLDILYAGKPLPPHRKLYWAVRAWDRQGRPSAWSSAMFSTGFVPPAAWTAPWIGFDRLRNALRGDDDGLASASWIMSPADEPGRAREGSRFFATTLELPPDAKVKLAYIHLSADDQFRLRVNDVEVAASEGVDGWRTPRSIDLTRQLHAGQNAIQIEVQNTSEGPTGLLASLLVGLADGTMVRRVTDETWQSIDAPGQTPRAAKVLGKNGIPPWHKVSARPILLPPVPRLRKMFTLEKPVRRATLYVAELGNADVYLNGRRVTDERYGSGWTDYSKRVYYRADDVSDRLQTGRNTLGALLADGWYSGYVGYAHERDLYGKNPRLAAELVIENQDGTSASITSDSSWKAATSATLEADFLLGEMFDARLAGDSWASPQFDDGNWSPVDVGAEVKPIVQWHPSQPVREYETFTAKKTTEPRPGVYVIDLGQNFAGVARLRVKNTRPGQTIVMRFAERLNPDGTIYTTNLRFARSTDAYICRGAALEEWEPRFTFHGFQYVEITGLKEPPESDTVTGVAFSSDTPMTGSFECSDPMINRLYKNILYTQRSNFIDIPTDCPQRDERLGWTADAQVYLNAAILNTDVQPFFTKWLLDLTDAQRADGQFPMVAPLKVAGDDGGPAWADAGTIAPWAIYQAYGDKQLLARQYPSMKKFVEFCRFRFGEALLPPKEFHAFGDWLSINAETPKDVIYTAYFAHSTDLLAKAARELGEVEDAKRYEELFSRLKQSFHNAYVAADGRIKGDTQTCYVLAIAYHLVDGSDREAAAKHLVENIEARGWHLSTGFLGTKELMLVLSDIGRSDVAFRLLHNETFPSWGFSIRQGATSIWERWDGWTPEKGFQDPGMNSFAHYSFGAVYQWMVENIGGIHAITDGARTIRISPQLDPQLTWANVSYHSPCGEVRSEWKLDGDRLSLHIVVPANVSATITVPGREVREGGKPCSSTMNVGGGDYRFESIIER